MGFRPMILLLLCAALVSTRASGDRHVFSEWEVCKAALLSPAQEALRNQIAAKSITIDLRSFSAEVSGDRIFFQYFNLDEASVRRAIAAGDEEFFTRIYRAKREAWDVLWLIGSYPDEMVRRALFNEIVRAGDANGTAKLFGIALPPTGVRDWLAEPPKVSVAKLAADRDLFLETMRSSSPVQAEDIRKASLERTALCALYAPLRAGECAKALAEIVEKMNPREFSVLSEAQFEISRVDLFQKVVFDDVRYHAAAKGLARRLVALVDAGSPPGVDLITVVRDAFREVATSADEAEDMAWNFIGLYSVLGAEIGNNVRRLSTEVTDFAFSAHVAASAIQVLDARTHGSGRLFSVPSPLATNIDTGKPYHLLMSAFLARELVKQGYSATSASVATWLAQVGYQMLSKTRGREPIRAFVRSRVDYANLKIRFDLVNAAAGIRYGVESAKGSGKNLRLSIDDLFKLSLHAGKDVPLFTPDEARALFVAPGLPVYTKWTKIFQPKAIFRSAGLGDW